MQGEVGEPRRRRFIQCRHRDADDGHCQQAGHPKQPQHWCDANQEITLQCHAATLRRSPIGVES